MANPSRVGPYELLAELARGSSGAVFRARDPCLGREVAIKLLHAWSEEPEQLARFRVEMQAVARLRHPNVVSVHSAGTAEGRAYLVLELVRGESLAARLKRDGRLAPEAALALAHDLASALEHAHGRGVLHRDLKPQNVLLDEQGRARLVDFGLARVLDRTTQLTTSGTLLGTPLYMAPEQATAHGERIGPATDVWGLGATLYAALTGHPPFAAASSFAEMVRAITREAPRPPSALVPGLPPEVDALVQRCLEKEPGQRFPDARALLAAIDGVRAGEAPAGPPRRRARVRHGVALGLLALIGLASAAVVRSGAGPRRSTPPVEPRRAAAPPAAAPPAAAAPATSISAPPPAPRRPWAGRLEPGPDNALYYLDRVGEQGRTLIVPAGRSAEHRRFAALLGEEVEVEGSVDPFSGALSDARVVEPVWFEDLALELTSSDRGQLGGAELEVAFPPAFRGLLAAQRLTASGLRWRGGRVLVLELELGARPGVDAWLQERGPSRDRTIRWLGDRHPLQGEQRALIELEACQQRLGYSGSYAPLREPPRSAEVVADLFVHARLRGSEVTGWVPVVKLALELRPELRPPDPPR